MSCYLQQMDGARRHSVKSNASITERQIVHDLLHVWNLVPDPLEVERILVVTRVCIEQSEVGHGKVYLMGTKL